MNNLIGQQYEVQIKNKLLESHENVFLWNEIPCQIMYDSNLFKSFKNKTKYFRKIQYIKKENHGIMDTGCDIFYQNNNQWIIVQCKNYENTICQDKLAGFYYLMLVSDLNGELYYTSNLSNVITMYETDKIKFIKESFIEVNKINLVNNQIIEYKKIQLYDYQKDAVKQLNQKRNI